MLSGGGKKIEPMKTEKIDCGNSTFWNPSESRPQMKYENDTFC